MARSGLHEAYRLLHQAWRHLDPDAPEYRSIAESEVRRSEELLGRTIPLERQPIVDLLREMQPQIKANEHYRWLIEHGFRDYPEGLFFLTGPDRELTDEDREHLRASGWNLINRPEPINPLPMDGRT